MKHYPIWLSFFIVFLLCLSKGIARESSCTVTPKPDAIVYVDMKADQGLHVFWGEGELVEENILSTATDTRTLPPFVPVLSASYRHEIFVAYTGYRKGSLVLYRAYDRDDRSMLYNNLTIPFR